MATLAHKAARLERVIRRAHRTGQLREVCAKLVDKGANTTGSRVTWKTLHELMELCGMAWDQHPIKDSDR